MIRYTVQLSCSVKKMCFVVRPVEFTVSVADRRLLFTQSIQTIYVSVKDLTYSL